MFRRLLHSVAILSVLIAGSPNCANPVDEPEFSMEELREMQGVYFDEQRRLPVSVQIASFEDKVGCFSWIDTIIKGAVVKYRSGAATLGDYSIESRGDSFTFNHRDFNRVSSVPQDEIFEVSMKATFPETGSCSTFWYRVNKGLSDYPAWCWSDTQAQKRTCVFHYFDDPSSFPIRFEGELSSKGFVGQLIEPFPGTITAQISIESGSKFDLDAEFAGSVHILSYYPYGYACESTVPTVLKIKRHLLDQESCRSAPVGQTEPW